MSVDTIPFSPEAEHELEEALAHAIPERTNGITALQRIEKGLARMPLARLTTVVPRTAGWAWEALATEAGRLPGAPKVRMTASLAAHVAMDESIMALVSGPNRVPRRADYERVSSELAVAAELFERRGWLADPLSYHQSPPEIDNVYESTGWALGQSYRRLAWLSGFEVRAEEPGAERWMSYESNNTASAWVLEHQDGPRPWVVAVHGFGTGAPFADMITFRAQHLHQDLGWNVAAIVLPVHGSRRPSKIGGEEFLGFDMMNSVHGVSQSVWDIRRLISWVRTRDPLAVVLHGVSLGGYLTSLTACFESQLDAVIPGIPVSDFPSLFMRHAPRHVNERAMEHKILHGNAEVVHHVVSPLVLEPVVAHERRHIFAGLGDRMAPPTQAHGLWVHWDEPDICWFPGNHVGYLWSKKVADFVDGILQDLHPVPAS